MLSKETIRSVIHAVLIFAVGLFYCLGPSCTIEVKHYHAHDDEHCKSYDIVCNHDSGHGHSHDEHRNHNHDHGDEENEHDDDHSKDPHDRSHSHSHFVSIDVPAACLSKVPSTECSQMVKYSYSRVSDTAPDGPIYDLIKPPQLG